MYREGLEQGRQRKGREGDEGLVGHHARDFGLTSFGCGVRSSPLWPD